MESELTVLDLLHAENRLAALRERKALIASNGLAAYTPHHKQDQFHRAGNFRARYVRTGNRFGKSLMGSAEDCAFARGERSWLDKDDPARFLGIPRRSTKGLIIVADWGKAHEIFTNEEPGQARGKLFKLLPDGCFRPRREHGNICEVFVDSIWGGVSSITIDTIKSYKSNKLGSESGDYDWIHVDEPCPEAMFKAFARGLVDRGGSYWFTCTPLMEMWINDLFQPDGNFRDDLSQAYIHRQEIKLDGVDTPIQIESWMITGSMHDNPTLTAQAKAEFISTLKPEEVETRIDGKPSQLTGVVYPQFNPSDIEAGGHVWRNSLPKGWTSPWQPPADWTKRIAIDTHPATNHAVLFAATGPTGHTVFYDEIWDHPFMDVLCQMILSRLGGNLPFRCLLELAAYNESPYEGAITLADEIIRGSLTNIEPAVKDLQHGIMATQQALHKRDKDGKPFLTFMPHLYRTLREFDRYVWDPEKGKPVDKDDHMMENLYRLVITDLTWAPPVEVKARRADQLSIPSFRSMALPKLTEKGLPSLAKAKPQTNLDKRYPKDRRSSSEESLVVISPSGKIIRNY